MDSSETLSARFLGNLSTVIVITGVLTLGVGGFLLLCLIAYAMVTENVVLAFAGGLLLFSPYILGVVWFLTLGTSLWADRTPTGVSKVARASAQT